MDLGAFLLAMLLSFGIKGPVMIFTAILVVRMLKLRKEHNDASDFRYLFYSLLLFAASELFCAFETYILKHAHVVGRTLHALSSGLGMAFFALGLFLLLDRRVIAFATPKCFAHSFCRSCTALSRAACQFSTLTIIVFVFLLFACVPPLFVSVNDMSANSALYVLPFESWNTWYDTVAVPCFRSLDAGYQPISEAMRLTMAPQILVSKIMPLMTFLLTLIGLLMFLRNNLKTQMRAICLVMFATGFLGYTYNELILHRIAGDLLIGGVGHEIGEFLYLLVFAQILKIFYVKRGEGSLPRP